MNNFLLGIIATLMFEIVVVGIVDIAVREGASVTPTPAQVTVQTFTLTDIAKHNSASSCYSTINGSVYDLTSWISEHPGGERAILSLCGRDGSEAFDTKHSDDRRPAEELAHFKIGALAQ